MKVKYPKSTKGIVVLFTVLLFTFFFLSQRFHYSKIAQTTQLRGNYCDNIDSIENIKQAWGELITHHPFTTRPHLSEEVAEEELATDRPDLAFELDFLKTMDPALGAVPYERLFSANQEIDRELKKRAPISGVNWTERGPANVGGRSRAIMFDPNDATHKKVWAGGIGGGLWYTSDVTLASPVWNKVNDLWDNIAITTIAYNPNNTQEFYVGTGEGWANYDAQQGSGIWKSSNGGSSWAVLGPTIPGAYNSSNDFHYVQKIAIKSNGYIFAATRGYFVNSGGIMRSIDNGNTWTKVLTVYTGAGTLYDRACDVEVAANGDVFASFGISSAGKVFKSLNASNGASGTWTDLSTNIGVANAQRIELACAPSNSSVIYAVAYGGSGINDIEWFKRTINGGTTWSSLAIPRLPDDGTTHFTNGQGYYDLILAVHPTNSDFILAGGINLHRSTNGGTSWSPISHWYGGFSQPYVHADQHMIQFRPGFSNEVIFGNDGGIFYSTNAGNSGATPAFADKNSGYRVTQFYSCAVRNEYNGNYFLAGAQDNGTQKFTLPGLQNTSSAIGGDGGFCHIDQLDGDNQFAAYTYNNLYRSLDGGYTFDPFIAENTGLFINPTDYDNTRKILYCSADPDFIKRISNITGTPVNTDISVSLGVATISALKVSPYNDVVFLGVENGRIYKLSSASTGAPSLTRIDNGATPINTAGFVSSIDVGVDDGHILITFSNYGITSVWQTADGGAHWFSKEGNLPDIPINWAIYNPNNRNQVIAATELGVWTTDNFVPTGVGVPVWGEGNSGLAHTRCDMLKYRASDKMVVIATHGRGLYTTDVFVASTVADFSSDANATCSGSLTVHFYDTSLKPNGTWAWDVDNNGTTDYTTQNPTHTYSSPGAYTVKLTVNNGTVSVTKQNFIVVLNNEPTVNTGCSIGSNSNAGNPGAVGIFRFALGSIDNSTPNDDGEYHNYVCTGATSLDLNTTYNVTVQTSYLNNEGARYYIDYNNNGIFESGESAVSFPANMDGTRTISFTTPSSGVITNKALRTRILSRLGNVPADACNVGTYGQAEDYSVYFNCTLLVTLASGTTAGSLPAAINCANAGDTIKISASLANQTINTGSSIIAINKNLFIKALGSNTNITTAGTGVFDIVPGTTLDLTGLTITAGSSLTFGAINNQGNLKMTNVNIHRNASFSNAIILRNNPGAICLMLGICLVQQ
ncbi:MAG: GEVED domain-containing protein [Saprospiraceae bacterium]